MEESNLSKLEKSISREADSWKIEPSARLLWYYSSAVTITSFFYVNLFYFYFDIPVIALSSVVCGLLVCFAAPIYKWSGSWSLGINTVLFPTFCVLLTANTVMGGLDSSGMYYFTIYPIIGGMLDGKRTACIWAIIPILGGVGLFAWQELVGEFVNLASPDQRPYLRFADFTIIIILSMTFTLFFVSTVTKASLRITEKERQNKRLLQILSHDISNPLTLIDTYSKLALENPGQDATTNLKSWTRIKKATMTIMNILDRVRAAQAIQDSKFSMDPVAIDLESAVEHARFIFEEQLKTKNIDLKHSHSEAGNCTFICDKVLFENQILNNILSNAIKFSIAGSEIVVESTIEGRRVHIAIQDRGIGIPAHLLDEIYSTGKFNSRKGTNGEVGTGFGMSLIKSSVEGTAGEIKIDSKCISEFPEDHGTTIHLYFKHAA